MSEIVVPNWDEIAFYYFCQPTRERKQGSFLQFQDTEMAVIEN